MKINYFIPSKIFLSSINGIQVGLDLILLFHKAILLNYREDKFFFKIHFHTTALSSNSRGFDNFLNAKVIYLILAANQYNFQLIHK